MSGKGPATAPDAINSEGEPRNPGAKSAMDHALARLEARNAPQYDGLNGQLPDWIPLPLKHEFKAVRDRLLDSESSDDVQHWMNLWRSTKTADGWMYVPPEYDRDVDSLVYIQSIVTLGQKAGIDAYLGRGGMEVVRGMALVDRNRKAAQQRRNDGLQRVILNLLRQREDGEPAGPYIERHLKEMCELRHAEDGVIFGDIDDERIYWSEVHAITDGTEPSDADTTTRSAPLSGLKDRVSHAKRQLQKEKPD